MLVDPDKPPAFCKLLQSREAFMKKLQLPASFIKEHKKMLSKGCVLKTEVSEMWWEAKIEREKPNNYFICEGEWPQFVMHHHLKHGDVLLFFLVEKSTFRVQPYTQKCCRNIIREKQLFYEELSSSSEEEIGPSLRKSKRARKMDPKIGALDTEEDSDDTSSSDGDDPSYAHRAIYYKNPKREKASSEEKEEAESESEEENDPKKSRGGSTSVVNFNSNHPYYEMVVKKAHKTYMTIPMTFAKRTGIIDMKKMRLVNEKEKEEWEVEIVHARSRVSIKKGWAEFRTYNKITDGDACRFKLLQGLAHAAANVLQVQKISEPHSSQYD